MKLLISFLFFLAAIAAPLSAYSKPTSTWLLVALLFEGNEVVNSKMFGGLPTAEKCAEAKAQLAKEAAEAKVEVWSACIELAREPAPLGDPKTKQSS
jgi:hypothetical protein